MFSPNEIYTTYLSYPWRGVHSRWNINSYWLHGHLEIKVTERQSGVGWTCRSARKMQGLLSEDNASPSYGPLLSEPSVYMTDWVINAALLHRFMYERTVFSCSAVQLHTSLSACICYYNFKMGYTWHVYLCEYAFLFSVSVNMCVCSKELISGNGQQATPVPVERMIYGTLILNGWIRANVSVRGHRLGEISDKSAWQAIETNMITPDNL